MFSVARILSLITLLLLGTLLAAAPPSSAIERSSAEGAALDAPDLAWVNIDARRWQVSSDGYQVYGSTYLSHSTLQSNESSRLETFVTGPAELRFRYRYSPSYSTPDPERQPTFKLLIDDVEALDLRQTSNDWLTATVPIPTGAHRVSWLLARAQPLNSFTVTARLDFVEVFGAAAPSSAAVDALDTTATLFLSNDPSNFIPTSDTLAVGGDALAIGGLSDNGQATLRVQVTGPKLIRYRWRTSTEEHLDVFDVLIDHTLAERLSGETEWREGTLTVPGGEHDIEWQYRKDASLAAGEDKAWLDDLRVEESMHSGALGLPPGVTPDSSMRDSIWQIDPDGGSHGGVCLMGRLLWNSSDTAISGVINIDGEGGIISFRMRADLSGNQTNLRFVVATPGQYGSGLILYSGTTAWTQLDVPLNPGAQRLIVEILRGDGGRGASVGEVFIEGIEFHPNPPIGHNVAAAKALDAPRLQTSNTPAAVAWRVVGEPSFAGGWALEAPLFLGGRIVTIQRLVIPGPGIVSWTWKWVDPGQSSASAYANWGTGSSIATASRDGVARRVSVATPATLPATLQFRYSPGDSTYSIAPTQFVIDDVEFYQAPQASNLLPVGQLAGIARWQHGIAEDTNGDLVLMGGVSPSGDFVEGIWKFRPGRGWEYLPTYLYTFPGAAQLAVVSFPPLQRVVAYGGTIDYNSSYPPITTRAYFVYGDQLNYDYISSYRTNTAGAYDSDRQRIVCFGGLDGWKDVGDTVEFRATSSTKGSWSIVATGTAPRPRGFAAMAYDPIRKRTLMYSGMNGNEYLRDMWAWDGSRWTNMGGQDAAFLAPGFRSRAEMVFDQSRGKIVLMGGDLAGVPFADTWELDTDGWHRIAGDTLGARTMFAATYSTALGGVVAHGGTGDWSGPRADTMILRGDHWERLDPPGPPQVAFSEAVWDAAREEVILVGGYTIDGPLAGTWAWDGVGAWHRVSDFAPPVRRGHRLAFDPVAGVVYLHGGEGDDKLVSADTWKWDGAEWSLVATDGPKLRDFGMAYERAGNRLLLQGGVTRGGSSGSYTAKSETWVWDGAAWSQLSPASVPSALTAPAHMIVDPMTDQVRFYNEGFSAVYLWGGDRWVGNSLGTYATSLVHSGTGALLCGSEQLLFRFALAPPTWVQIAAAARSNNYCRGGQLLYLPKIDRVVYFGGQWTTSGDIEPGYRFFEGEGPADIGPSGLLAY